MSKLRRTLTALAKVKTEVVQVVGLAIIAVGLGDIYRPAGVIFGGAAIVVLAELANLRGKKES